jgi:hypothetical protein
MMGEKNRLHSEDLSGIPDIENSDIDEHFGRNGTVRYCCPSAEYE